MDLLLDLDEHPDEHMHDQHRQIGICISMQMADLPEYLLDSLSICMSK